MRLSFSPNLFTPSNASGRVAMVCLAKADQASCRSRGERGGSEAMALDCCGVKEEAIL